MQHPPVYFHVTPDGKFPELQHLAPFRAVLAVESSVTSAWQEQVSLCLVRSGCLYMLAWGRDCSSWDDSVDLANLSQFEFGSVPPEKRVMSTWHANQPLGLALAFCKHHAVHPVVELSHTVLLHISECSDERRLVNGYAEA